MALDREDWLEALIRFTWLNCQFFSENRNFIFYVCLCSTCASLMGKENVMAIPSIKAEILAALSHPEAEDGLYFNNLIVVHEEEERPIVHGEESQVNGALEELAHEGKILVLGDGEQRIFRLA